MLSQSLREIPSGSSPVRVKCDLHNCECVCAATSSCLIPCSSEFAGLARMGSAASMRPGSSLRPAPVDGMGGGGSGMTADDMANAVQMLRLLKASQSMGSIVSGAPDAHGAEAGDDGAQRSLAFFALAQGPHADQGAAWAGVTVHDVAAAHGCLLKPSRCTLGVGGWGG